MMSLIYGLLSAALFGISAWLWRRRGGLNDNARGAITAALLALLLPAASSLLLTLDSFALSETLTHIQRMLGLAAQNISLPLLGLTAFYMAFGLRWQPANWGRILLGLMAAFELTRRMDMQHNYQWSINLLSLALLLLAGALILRRDLRPMLFGSLAAIGIGAPLFSPGAAALAGLLSSSPLALWLFPTLLGAGLAVGLLSEQAHNSHNESVEAPNAERT